MNYYNTGNGRYQQQYPPDFDYQQSYIRIKEERDTLKLLGRCTGLSLISYVLLSNLLGSIVVAIPTLYRLYSDDLAFFYGFNILVSVVSIFLPFIAAGGAIKRRMPGTELLPLDAPDKPSLVFLAAPIGLAICILGNYAAGLFQSFITGFGVELSAPSFSEPTDALETLVYCVYVTIGTALIEETVVRGVIMQPLRRFGNGFAVVVSALVFGIMHCNLIQAPFAFIAGLGMGYFAIATGSLWTSVLIHFLNNLFSVVINRLGGVMEQQDHVVFYYICVAVIFAAALFCLIAFIRIRGSLRLPGAESALKHGKARVYFSSIPIIIAIIMIIYVMADYVGLR